MPFGFFNQSATKAAVPAVPEIPPESFSIPALRAANHPLAASLDMMAEHSELGARIVGWAEKNKIDFKFHTFKNSFGDYISSDRLVRVHAANSFLLNFTVIGHELFHAVQDITKESLQDPEDASYRTLLARAHCIEAAAETCAIRIAYEAKLNGYTDPFDEVFKNQEIRGYRPLYREFDVTYRKAWEAGKSHDDAIQEASNRACNAWMASQSLKDGYNSGQLAHYIRRLVDEHKFNSLPTPTFGQQTAQNIGYMNKDEFIADIKMPLTDLDLFGSNTLMKQAFEFVEYHHIFWWADSADTNWGVCKKLYELEQDNNPYLNAYCDRGNFDLRKLLETYDEEYEKNGTADMFDIINKAAGIDPGIQLSFDFFAAANQDAQPIDESTPVPKPHAAYTL